MRLFVVSVKTFLSDLFDHRSRFLAHISHDVELTNCISLTFLIFEVDRIRFAELKMRSALEIKLVLHFDNQLVRFAVLARLFHQVGKHGAILAEA